MENIGNRSVIKSTLDTLLAMEIAKPEHKLFKVRRLSELCGADICFTLRELSYSRVAEIKKINGNDMAIHITLAGTAEPDLKSTALMEKYGAVTPAELVCKMLRPGEIEDISREIQRLSGYLADTIEEIKKK